jgi:hypothetical protein
MPTLTFPLDLHRKLEKIAPKNNLSMADVIRLCLALPANCQNSYQSSGSNKFQSAEIKRLKRLRPITVWRQRIRTNPDRRRLRNFPRARHRPNRKQSPRVAPDWRFSALQLFDRASVKRKSHLRPTNNSFPNLAPLRFCRHFSNNDSRIVAGGVLQCNMNVAVLFNVQRSDAPDRAKQLFSIPVRSDC